MLVGSIYKLREIEIFAWCIMTNHVHLVFRSIDGLNPANLLGDLKRFTSKAIVKAIQENPRESRKQDPLSKIKLKPKMNNSPQSM